MIDQDGHARLADFGLLAFVSDPSNPTNSSSGPNAGTIRWMSPELLHPERFGLNQGRPTEKSDCYALGMVTLEVLSGERPFPRDQDFIVMRKVIEGEHPERPEGEWFTDGLWRTLEQCWSPQPNDRPTIETVLECLEHVSTICQPLPPIGEDVETNNHVLVSATVRGMVLRFTSRLLLKTGAGTSEFVSDPPRSNTPVVLDSEPKENPPFLSAQK